MKQTARVRKILPDGTAQLVPERFLDCGGKCSGCGGCGSQTTLWADNPIGAKPGELVELKSRIPALKILLYLVPVALFFLGYLCGSLLNWEDGAACCGLLLGCLIAFCLRGKPKPRYTIAGYPTVWT